MNGLCRAILAVMVVCALSTAALADVANFTFTRSGDGYVVTGYNGSETTVTVPDWYNGLPVTGIGASAFESNSTMTTVELPSSLTDIGAKAFKSCRKLSVISYYTAAAQPPEEEKPLPGNANNDETVNIHDALRIMQYCAGWGSVSVADTADVTGDGYVKLDDAVLILRYCAGESGVTLQ